MSLCSIYSHFGKPNIARSIRLLASLEQEGHVAFVHVPQSDKPDKKVYSITEQGKDALREWIAEPTDDPVTRDELALKVYCIGLVDKEQAKKVIAAREVYYRKKKSDSHSSWTKSSKRVINRSRR